MNRSLGIERVYSLGDYKSIRFTDTIVDLPEEVALNREAVNILRVLQMLEVDSAYHTYVFLARSTVSMGEEERLKYLEEEKQKFLTELKRIIAKE